jgi:secondary thiamine-phosphate synthase enzyme
MFNQTIIATAQPKQVIDVTDAAVRLLHEQGDGLAFYYLPHTTATLLMSEDDAELRGDLIQVATRWLKDCGPFRHIKKNNPNAEAHILSSLGGHGVTVAVKGGKLDLGEYQRLLLLELDGPKKRELRLCYIPLR